jgi:hypothetical protein
MVTYIGARLILLQLLFFNISSILKICKKNLFLMSTHQKYLKLQKKIKIKK